LSIIGRLFHTCDFDVANKVSEPGMDEKSDFAVFVPRVHRKICVTACGKQVLNGGSEIALVKD
jgi:hypothetical protein